MRALYLAMFDRQIAKGRTVDQAIDWMKKLAGAVAKYVPYSQLMFSTVGKGVLPFSFWNASEVVMRQRQGYPIDFVYPASGMPVLRDCVAMVKRAAAHPLAAQFYEFVTSKEFATKLSEQPFNRIHVRSGLGKLARPDYLVNPKFKEMAIDWRRVEANESVWMERWEKEVASQPKTVY
jgi:iron(III) transport system substrate-binding protein